MTARIDVMIPGGHHLLVVTPRTPLNQFRDRRSDPRASRDRNAASFTEVVLPIHDDQATAHHEHLSSLWNTERTTSET